MCILYYKLNTCIIKGKPTSKLRNHVNDDPDSTDGALSSGNSDKMSQSTVLHTCLYVREGLGIIGLPGPSCELCVSKSSPCADIFQFHSRYFWWILRAVVWMCVWRGERRAALWEKKVVCDDVCVYLGIGVWKNKQACLCEFGYFFVRMHQAGGATGKRKLPLKSTVDFHSLGNACEIKSFSFNILYYSPKRPCSINIFFLSCFLNLSAIFFNAVSYFL